MKQDSTHTIGKAIRHFFSGTMLSRISGMFRDMALAFAFGTNASIASFMVAVRFAHLLRRLFGEGALQSAFIPEFEALRHENSERAFSFFRDLMALLTLFLSLLIIVVSIGLAVGLAYGNFSEGNQEIISLTIWMLPSLLFLCLYGFNSSLLQCERNYFISSVAPVAFNAIWIVSVWWLRNEPLSEAMPKLAFGVVIACLFQWLMTVPKTLKVLKNSLSTPIFHSIRLRSPDIMKFGMPLLLGIIGVAASQINNAVDALFARWAEPEGPALLWYAIRLQQLPLGLFGIAVAGAILPPLSRAIKAKDYSGYQSFLNYALRNTFSVMFPATCLLLVMGDSCVNLLYGHGDFDSWSVVATTRCLWAYALGLVPSALILILAPACFAQKDYRWPTYASFLAMFLNAGLNAFMIMFMGFGAMSVALATSISAWVNLFFLTIVLTYKNGSLLTYELSTHMSKIVLVSLLGSLGTIAMRLFILDVAFPALSFNSGALYSNHVLTQFLFCLSDGLSFIIPFGIASFFFGTYFGQTVQTTEHKI